MRHPWNAAVAGGLLLAATLAAPVHGQEPDALSGLVDTLALLWTEGDAAALAAHGSRVGLDLEVHGDVMGPLQGRRVAAALRQLFQGQVTVSVESATAAKVTGTEDRAFGEFIWTVRMPGADVTEDNRIFMALVREESQWRVSQIRIMR